MALLEFYGTECPHCITMAPLVERLRKEGFKVEQYECWHNDDNEKKRMEHDQGYCGGVPFFFNTESGRWICGEADYEELKAWARGKKA